MDHQPGKAERIRSELTCPQCDYSLRGLHGDVVTCPECGHECNVTAMMTRRWTGPWYNAPGFNTLLGPLVWFVLLSSSGVLVVVYEQSNGGNGLIALLTYTAITIVWIVLLWRVRDVPTEGQGLRLALLAHGLFAGYIGGIIAIVMMIGAIVNASGVVRYAAVVLLPAGIGVLLLMRRGEKYIAQQCIKAWLNRPTEQ